jgi:hypothetical protein
LKKWIDKLFNKLGYEKRIDNTQILEKLYFKEYHRILNPKIIKAETEINFHSDIPKHIIKQELNNNIFKQLEEYIYYEDYVEPLYNNKKIMANLIIGEKQK